MKRTENKIQFRSLGTTITIILVGAGESERIEQKLKNLFFSYQSRLSRFEKESEISRINRNLGKWIEVSNHVQHLAETALDFHKASQGIFDPRIIDVLEKLGYDKDFSNIEGGELTKAKDLQERFSKDLGTDLKLDGSRIKAEKRIDLGGIAKGYIVDQTVGFLKHNGWNDFLVDAGGDMFASGKNRKNHSWKIAIEGYCEKKLMLALSGHGIATTGISRKRWWAGGKEVHHLINLKNPDKFSFELRSVTVVAKNSKTADGWAKVLFILGKEKGVRLAEEKKIAALFLDKKGNITYTKKLKPFLLI